MGRVHEVDEIRDEHQARWLAGQLDELELEVLRRLEALTEELTATRRVLTAILIALVTASLTIPVGLIWAAGIG